MRDIKRIEPFLNALKSLWEKNPDLRFFQLIASIDKSKQESFYAEDPMVLKLIEEKMVSVETEGNNNDSKRSTKISSES